MDNFFLLNESIIVGDFEVFQKGMSELNLITRNSIEDLFLKHDSIWSIEDVIELFSDPSFANLAITKFISQLTSITNYIGDENKFDEDYPNEDNGFLGIDFSSTAITSPRQIIDQNTYDQFKHDNLWNVTFRNFWSKREKLFPNIILCGQVENQISRIGNSGHFNQIVDRLKEFDEALAEWTDGDFSYRQINNNSSLRISPESDQTMSKFGNERRFSLPSGGTEFFELHIKTGDLRFHFYPNNYTKETFVGYIGPHLNTVSN